MNIKAPFDDSSLSKSIKIQSKVALFQQRGMPLMLSDIAIEADFSSCVLIRVHAAVFGKALVRAITVGHPKIHPPVVLGTLVAGEVVTENNFVPIGTRIVVDPHVPCGLCEKCIRGHEAL